MVVSCGLPASRLDECNGQALALIFVMASRPPNAAFRPDLLT